MEDGPGTFLTGRSLPSISRVRLAMLLLVIAVVGFAVLAYKDFRDEERQLPADYRAPVANPPVDPNRPDLLEEPRIDEKRQ